MRDRQSAMVRFVMGWWLSFSERKQRKLLKSAFDIIATEAIKSRSRDFPASATMLNICLYFLIAERDIQTLKIGALTHSDDWTRKLYLRIILLTIYELDLDKVSGGALKSAFQTANISEELQTQAFGILRAIRVVQRQATQNFRLLRNTTIGHRNTDAVAQFQAINELTTNDVFLIAKDFYAAARPLIDILPKLLAEASTPLALIRQWATVQDAKEGKI